MNYITSTFFNFKFIIGLIISIGGLWLAFNDFEYYSFINAMKGTKVIYILFATGVLILSVWVRSIRWKYLLSHEKEISTKTLFTTEMIGYFGNNVLPFRLGEGLRCVILGKQETLPYSLVFGSIVLERILDTIGLVALALLLMFFYPIDAEIREYIYLGFFISIGLGILLILFSKYIKKRKIPINSIIFNFFSGISGLKSKFKIRSVTISILLWIMYWFDTHMIQAAFNLNMTIMESLLILVFASLALSIPSAPGMIGTFHLAVNYTMEGILEVSPSVANPFTIVLHAYGFISLTIIGAYYFLNNQFHKQALFELNNTKDIIT